MKEKSGGLRPVALDCRCGDFDTIFSILTSTETQLMPALSQNFRKLETSLTFASY